MDNVLVLYASKYGFTKKYAEWISSELNGDIYSIKDFKQNIINNYNTIILGSGLYAGKIDGINIIVNNYETIKNRRLVLFTCGLADYSKVENRNNIRKRLGKIIPENIISKIEVFYL
jgi:menaquinone-dependent protoporphyrinogen IX oxidase